MGCGFGDWVWGLSNGFEFRNRAIGLWVMGIWYG